MRSLVALMLVCLGCCGTEEETILLVIVDTTSVAPTPNSLYLTITAANGDSLSRTSSVATDGVTRIAIIASARTPESGELAIVAYASRDVVSVSGATPYQLASERTTTLDVTMP